VFSEEEAMRLEGALAEFDDCEELEIAREEDEDQFFMVLAQKGYKTTEAFEDNMREKGSELEAVRRELGKDKAFAIEKSFWKRKAEETLVATADTELNEVQLKEKRRLRSIRAAAEAKAKIMKIRDEEQNKKRMDLELKEKRKREDPDGYLAELQSERQSIVTRIKKRTVANASGSDRRSQASRQRMRLLAQQAGPGGDLTKKAKKSESDDFGTKDSDWDVYRDIRGIDSEEEVEEQERLRALESEIRSIDPTFEPEDEKLPRGAAKLYVVPPETDEFIIAVDRVRTPEIIWQPSLIGMDQCGLGEAIGLSFSSLNLTLGAPIGRSVIQEVFVTGGPSLSPGFTERVARELLMQIPEDVGRGSRVWQARDPVLDAWRGAALFARAQPERFGEACVGRAEYEEKGSDYLREHMCGNTYVPTPQVERLNPGKKKR